MVFSPKMGLIRLPRFSAYPVILSTRNNGIPGMSYPNITSYNYLIAYVHVEGRSYLLDATDKYRPYNILPERVLNGRGMVISKDYHQWVDLKMDERSSRSIFAQLTLDPDDGIKGIIQ